METIVEAALRDAEALLPSEERDELRHHALADSLEALKLDEARRIGYTFKCLGCGTWALRRGPAIGFVEAIKKIVLEAGDADTNATVAGALLGCHLGYSQLPSSWIVGMPYTAWLEAWVQKLLHMLQLPTVIQSVGKSEA